MTGAQVVARAMSAVGGKCVYGLGKGGFDPVSPHPWNKSRECDCSGFVSWALAVSRLVDAGHPFHSIFPAWVETSNIYRDANDATPGAFARIEWAQARPGDLLVYGDKKHERLVRQGHVAVVVAVANGGPLRLIHCSATNQRLFGDAIFETDVAGYWRERHAVVARAVTVTGGA